MLTALPTVFFTLVLPVWQEARGAVVGSVVDRRNQPWPNATVHLHSHLVRWSDGPVDRVEARSNARGRFRADLLRGRTYTVWASGGGPIRDRLTAAREGVHAGEKIELRETSRSPERIELRLRSDDLADWANFGPLRYRFVANTENPIYVDVVPDERNTLRLSWPLPGSQLFFEARLSNGATVLRQKVPARRASSLVRIPIPHPMRIRVVSQRDEPLAGARIATRSGLFWRTRGHTRADGTLRFVWPVPRQSTLTQRLEILIGSARNGQTWFRPYFRYTPRDRLSDAAEIDFVAKLRSPASLRGRVFLAAGKPAASIPILLRVPRYKSDRSWSVDTPQVFRSRVDGSFAVPIVPGDARYMLSTILDQAALRAAGFAENQFPREVLLHAGRIADAQLGNLEIARIPRTRVEVKRADGAPARFASVDVLYTGSGLRSQLVVTGRAGRDGALTVAGPGGVYDVVASLVTRGARRLNLPVAKEVQEVRLGVPVSVRGLVVTEDGDPVPGAVVACGVYCPRTRGRLVSSISERRVETGPEGTFEIEMAHGDVLHQVRISYRRGRRRFRTTKMLKKQVPLGGLRDLVFTLPKLRLSPPRVKR